MSHLRSLIVVVNVPRSGLPEAKVCDLGLAKGLSSKIKEAKETGGIGTRNYWPPVSDHKKADSS